MPRDVAPIRSAKRLERACTHVQAATASQSEGNRRAMNIRIWTGVALLLTTGTAFAQRPLIYPMRSQSPGAQSVDSAYCYWQAKTQSGVDIARQPQRPFRTKPIDFAPAAGSGTGTTEPPLPLPASQSRGDGATNAARATGASAAASAPMPAASAASMPPATGASTVAAASQSGSASDAKLPPLPPPEPPMTTYWHAYGDCMQSRGYGVR